MIAELPRGGPAAAPWDRCFETSRPELLDRNDVEPRVREQVIRGLDRFHRLTGSYHQMTRWVTSVAPTPTARILELGAGHGSLGLEIASRRPGCEVTLSDIDADCVDRMRDRAAGHERVNVQRLDATDIAAPDGSWDVAVMALTLHHLRPTEAARAIAEATRVASSFVVIDVWRSPLTLAVAPALLAVGGWPLVHDGVISLRKMYGAAAIEALAAEAGDIVVDCRVRLPGFLHVTLRRRTWQADRSGGNRAPAF